MSSNWYCRARFPWFSKKRGCLCCWLHSECVWIGLYFAYKQMIRILHDRQRFFYSWAFVYVSDDITYHWHTFRGSNSTGRRRCVSNAIIHILICNVLIQLYWFIINWAFEEIQCPTKRTMNHLHHIWTLHYADIHSEAKKVWRKCDKLHYLLCSWWLICECCAWVYSCFCIWSPTVGQCVQSNSGSDACHLNMENNDMFTAHTYDIMKNRKCVFNTNIFSQNNTINDSSIIACMKIF